MEEEGEVRDCGGMWRSADVEEKCGSGQHKKERKVVQITVGDVTAFSLGVQP